jgi:hypothetical protein
MRGEVAELDSLARRINEEHQAFVGSFKKTAEHGIRAGELLAAAKAKCKHGEWLPWIRENFEGSTRSAQVYRQMFNKREEIRSKYAGSAHLSISGALKEITSSSADPQAEPAEPRALEPRPEDWVDPQVLKRFIEIDAELVELGFGVLRGGDFPEVRPLELETAVRIYRLCDEAIQIGNQIREARLRASREQVQRLAHDLGVSPRDLVDV